MKKLILTMVAMMTFTFGFAGNESYRSEKSVANYVMSFDMRRLAATLDLNDAQMESVEAILNCFNNDMQSAASVRGPQCRHLVHEAVSKFLTKLLLHLVYKKNN